MVSLLNGFSQMGSAISTFGHDAGLEEQKSELERTNMILANQLKSDSDVKLAGVQGDQSRQTAVVTAGAQAQGEKDVAGYKNTLPMTAAEKATATIQQQEADARMIEAKKPVPASMYGGGWMVYDPKAPGGYRMQTLAGSDKTDQPADPTSNNLSAQTTLSDNAIAVATGHLNGRFAAPYRSELEAWGRKNGRDIDTLIPQAQAADTILKKNIERNNQGTILENELDGSIKNTSDIMDTIGRGQLSFVNGVAQWVGMQTNSDKAIQAQDQLARMRDELANYNAVASGHQKQDGSPFTTPEDIHAAEKTISDGINSGGLKALGQSIAMSAEKNRTVLEKSIEDAQTAKFKLFGATYHPAGSTQPGLGGANSPAGSVNPPPAKPDPDIQKQITSDAITATAKKRGMTEDQVKTELKNLGYTVP